MKRTLGICFALAVALLTVFSPAFAHHSRSNYGKTLTLQGTVTQFEWTNPHCLIHIDVKDETGKVVSWIVETHPPSLNARKGWTKNSLKPGDQVTLYVSAAKNGQSEGNLVTDPAQPREQGDGLVPEDLSKLGVGVRFTDGRTLAY